MSETTSTFPKQSRQRVWLNWLVILGAVCVTAVAAIVRWMTLDDLNYWFDESFTIRMSQYDVREIVVRCTRDTHPPLSFILLKGWIALFGISHIGARSFSLFWGILAVLSAYGFVYEAIFTLTGERFRSVFSAMAGSLCVALSPIQISWSQQVRMYSAVACLSILATWLLWRAFQKPSSIGRWMAFGIVELAGVYTHVTMLFVFLSHAIGGMLILWLRWRRQEGDRLTASRFLASFATVGILVLPWLFVIKTQHARVHDDFWIMPLTTELFWESIVKCFAVYQRPVENASLGMWISQGIVVVVGFVAIGKRSLHLLAATAAIVPILSLLILSVIDVNVVNGRYFMAAHAMLCVVAGIAVARVPFHSLRFLIALPLLVTLGYLCRDYLEWRQENSHMPGIPSILASYEENRAQDEPLIICNPMFYTTALMYADDTLPLFVNGELGDYPFFVGTAIMSEQEFKNADNLDQLGCKTLWVCDFGNRSRYINPVALSEKWQLTTETSASDYSGKYFLRRYDKIIVDSSLTDISYEAGQ